ncbi:hypothetical protein [uncultured Pseudokineococcus sp.]|uniref:hypothetical protein n=1 Tax=uncultured Pseudokineococcus sp. TaxID=1642928 RepID=UPI0026125A59|nr:hypothetical protein [uncultured Pseudokineococcus sp.]
MSATSAARAVRAASAAPARPIGPPRGRTARPGAALARSASSRPASRPAPSARAAAPAREAAAPRVRLVAPPASSRRRLPFGVLCGAVLLLSLLAVLLLNISLSHGAYELHEVQAQQQDAGERRQALTEQLERTQAPDELGRRAAALGMVPAGTAAFVHLPDGEVIGAPEVAPEAPEAAQDAAAVAPVDPDDVAADEPAPAEGAATAAEAAGTDETSDDRTADDETGEESAPR